MYIQGVRDSGAFGCRDIRFSKRVATDRTECELT